MSYGKKIEIRINHDIIANQIRLIDENGNMVGLVTPKQAMELASRARLDLVEISPNANPSVCKIMDFGKYKYELQKKSHEAKKKQKVVEIKEIKIRPNIADGDYNVKLKNTKRFIAEGNKVRVSLQFKGREITHMNLGFAVIDRFKNDIGEFAKIEVDAKLEGKQIFLVIAPA